MKPLNKNERAVFESAYRAAEANGFDFGWTEDIEVANMSRQQIGGYLTDLQSKGYLKMNDDPEWVGAFEIREKIIESREGRHRYRDGRAGLEWMLNQFFQAGWD